MELVTGAFSRPEFTLPGIVSPYNRVDTGGLRKVPGGNALVCLSIDVREIRNLPHVDQKLAAVLHDTLLAELVHEKCHPRASGAYHLCHHLMSEFDRDLDRVAPAYSQAAQLHEQPQQALLAGVEKMPA